MAYGEANPHLNGSSTRGPTPPTLPPLRELVPNFDRLPIAPPDPREPRAPIASATSSPGGDVTKAAYLASDYTHSPTQAKRRRLSYGDSGEQRDSRVPRSYSNFSMARREPLLDESHAEGGARLASGPYYPGHVAERRPQEARPGPYPSQQRPPVGPWGSSGGGVTLPRLHGIDHQPRSPLDTPRGNMSMYRFEGYHGAQSQQPQLHPGHGVYSAYQSDVMDRKPRKRRGNLPKETTDFLFKWLESHASHAYPTEDEKQWMMRQTGLQLNQISNWFINARRRKLPTMVANAKVEADVMGWPTSPRSVHGRTLSDGDTREAYASRQRSLKRGHDSMNRDSV
ncbi:hypothetical protein QBC39DRAFT_376706 [Podospora conica]|nr:hypothetical protein QBC39DRAFT_376706 [Schizothecium conicum]